MKKTVYILICLLLAALVCMPAAAEEESPGVVVQTSCNIVQSGDYSLVYCFAQVHNNSDQIICMDEGYYQLYNDEQLLAMDPVSQLWPYFVNPGEDGYLYEIVTFEPNENGVFVPTVSGLDFQIKYMTIDPAHAGKTLDVEASVEYDEARTQMTVLCRLTNPTQIDAFDPTIAFGLYTDEGRMVYTDGTTLKNMGIPAGGSMLVRFEVESALVEQWKTYGALPAHVRTNAAFNDDKD